MSADAPLLIQHLSGFYTMQVIAAGAASGALGALVDGGGTAREIAQRAGLDARNTAQWLRTMTIAGHAHHDDGVFTIDAQTATLLGEDFPVDLAAVLALVMALSAEPVRQLPTAMRTGAGIDSEVFAEVGAAVAGINGREYAAGLLEWIGRDDALAARLADGGAIADIACGNGDAAALMARAFPRSAVLGFDPGAPARTDVPNLTLLAETSDALGAHGPFALVTCLDSLHHLGRPEEVARSVAAALSDDGVFLVAETALSGDLDQDVADPFAVLTYAADLLYCMQENLAAGGDGATPSDGLGWVHTALASAGFGRVDEFDSASGFRVLLARR